MAGFKPVQDLSGSDYTGKVVTYGVLAAHATLLAVGDLVSITGTARASGLQEVDASAAAGLITGVIVSIDPNYSNLEQAGLPAGTAGTVKVAVDPMMLLEGTTSSTVAITDVGQNAEIVATEASLSGGLAYSNMTMDTSSFSAATAQLRLEGMKDGGTAAGSTVYCRINESTFAAVGI